MSVYTQTLEWEHGSAISIETGRLARQADGSVVLTCGETIMLATVVARKEIDPKIDFLPLSVDYKENYSSTGKFPGGYFKRDGRLNEYEILTSRIVDRSLRPLFPEDYHADIQVIISLLSNDRNVMPDALACVAASAALCVSDIPFPEPVSTVRIGYADGKFMVNPTRTELNNLLLDLMIAGTNDSIVMVEGEMNEVSEALMMEAFEIAHAAIRRLNDLQLKIRADVNKTTREYEAPPQDEDLKTAVFSFCAGKLMEVILQTLPKQERRKAFNSIRDEVIAALTADTPPETLEDKTRLIKRYYDLAEYNAVRTALLDHNLRLDGRKPEEIRPIWCEVGYLPRTHGSAIFTRGETQSLTTVTLGSKLDEQTLDYATLEGSKKFMLQYNFPPFSTGEIKPQRAPGRREIGHGNLAERALKNMIPTDNDYTIRVVSDILESNGSSSMATVCAGTLALMDAGIAIKRPVSGIAMGLVIEGEKFAILSDILGDEDHLGDMDFKTTGTEKGLTACQMDIKVRGLSYEILSKALYQAKAGREYILSKMMETLSAPRPDISEYAPRIITFAIPVDTIGAVIGPGGKVIQEIQRVTGTTINIEEVGNQGMVSIASPNKAALAEAERWVKGIVLPPTNGETYKAKVRNIREAGAFLEFMPGKDGWLHISEVSSERIGSMEDVLKLGDEVEVKLLGIDPRTNKFRLSMRAVNEPGYDLEAAMAALAGGGKSGGGDRRGGDKRGGNDKDRRGGDKRR